MSDAPSKTSQRLIALGRLSEVYAARSMRPAGPEWSVDTKRADAEKAELLTWAVDKIEGLEADLRMAVQTAYNRGAVEWAKLNYPSWADWLHASKTSQER